MRKITIMERKKAAEMFMNALKLTIISLLLYLFCSFLGNYGLNNSGTLPMLEDGVILMIGGAGGLFFLVIFIVSLLVVLYSALMYILGKK
jgi:polyferredoxin